MLCELVEHAVMDQLVLDMMDLLVGGVMTRVVAGELPGSSG